MDSSNIGDGYISKKIFFHSYKGVEKSTFLERLSRKSINMNTEKTRAEKLAIQKDYKLRKCQIKLAKEKSSHRWTYFLLILNTISAYIGLYHHYYKVD